MKKILSLENVMNKPYSKVVIELKDNCPINQIKEILSKEGETEINLILKLKIKKLIIP